MNLPENIPADEMATIKMEWEIGGGKVLELEEYSIFLTPKVDWRGTPFFACGEGNSDHVDHHVYVERGPMWMKAEGFSGCGDCPVYAACLSNDDIFRK
jgi:hypothetical protein